MSLIVEILAPVFLDQKDNNNTKISSVDPIISIEIDFDRHALCRYSNCHVEGGSSGTDVGTCRAISFRVTMIVWRMVVVVKFGIVALELMKVMEMFQLLTTKIVKTIMNQFVLN